jgi:hypothetical protein
MPKIEPVRWYGILAAVLALVAHYFDIPTPLFLAVGAAVLGVGVESARSHVVPTAKATRVGRVDEPAG